MTGEIKQKLIAIKNERNHIRTRQWDFDEDI